MLRVIRKSNRGGATIEYALFLSIAAVALVALIAVVGNEFRPQLVAWQQDNVEIDNTLTGAIVKDEDGVKTYRVLKFTRDLQPNTDEKE